MARIASGGMIPFNPGSRWTISATTSGKSSKDKEFGLIQFAAGIVTGARSFKVDKLGRLTGIHYPQVWKPGENVAECRKVDDFASTSYHVRTYSPGDVMSRDSRGDYIMFDGSKIPQSAFDSMVGRGGQISVPVMSPASVSASPAKPSKEHTIASCEHGFYAYYDGSDDYHGDGLVSGVVEGYGESVIGTRGFRCMKAKIVALTVSKDLAKPVAALVHRNYKDVPQFVTFEQMVKAFPTDSAGMEPAPETDEDFWTRSV